MAPKEGYMTIEEYNRLNLVYEAKTELKLHEESKFMRENADELVAKYRREQLKAVRDVALQHEVKEKEIEREGYTACEDIDEEPGTSARPFGKWQTVVHRYEELTKKNLFFPQKYTIRKMYIFFFKKGRRSRLTYSYQKQPIVIMSTCRL